VNAFSSFLRDQIQFANEIFPRPAPANAVEAQVVGVHRDRALIWQIEDEVTLMMSHSFLSCSLGTSAD
jgi:hypothetical protein